LPSSRFSQRPALTLSKNSPEIAQFRPGFLFSSIRVKIVLSFFLCVVLPVTLIIYIYHEAVAELHGDRAGGRNGGGAGRGGGTQPAGARSEAGSGGARAARGYLGIERTIRWQVKKPGKPQAADCRAFFSQRIENANNLVYHGRKRFR
jgi:type IV secretory pathway TrbL component